MAFRQSALPVISGASTINRPGITKLLADAATRRFDLVITESLDRLSRSQADIAALREVGYTQPFYSVDEGTTRYVHYLLKKAGE